MWGCARWRSPAPGPPLLLLCGDTPPVELHSFPTRRSSDPHVAARNLLPAVDIPGLGKRRVIAHPAKHAVTTIANPARVPKKGEHTEEILRSLGFSARQISGLSKKGIVAT